MFPLVTDFVAKVGRYRWDWCLLFRGTALTRRPWRSLLNSDATRCTEPWQVAVVRPGLRGVAGSERWRRGQTHPVSLADHAVEVDRASECASGVRTASQSSFAHVATAQSPRCQRRTVQRLGRVHGCRAGSCVRAPLLCAPQSRPVIEPRLRADPRRPNSDHPVIFCQARHFDLRPTRR
jgi:hypothetical protein